MVTDLNCERCKVTKHKRAFRKDIGYTGGYYTICNLCVKSYKPRACGSEESYNRGCGCIDCRHAHEKYWESYNSC